MSYVILWLGILAGFLLLHAFLIAVASHSDKKLVKRGLPYAFWILYIPIAAAAILTGTIYFNNIEPQWPFWYTLSLLLGITIGYFLIKRKGMRLPLGEEGPTEKTWLLKVRNILRLKKEAQVPAWPRMKLGAAFLIVSVFAVATYIYMDNSAREELARFQTETTDLLQKMMPPRAPDAQNARLVYEQASKSLEAEKDLPKWIKDKPADVSRQEIADFVEKNRKTLELLYKAAALPNFSYDVDMTKPAYAWPLPQYGSYRRMADLLYHSACLKADAGDAAGAMKDLSVIETMSNHFRTDRTLIATLVSFAIDDGRVRGAEHVIYRLPDRALRQPSPVKAHATALETIYKALRYEYAMISQGLPAVALGGSFSDVSSWAPLMSFYRVFFVTGDMKAQKVQSSIMARPVRTYEELKRNNREAIQAVKNTRGLLTAVNLGSAGYDRYIHRAMSYETNQGLADLGFAINSYKSTKGSYPERLEELVPDYIDRIPTDPFDGKPLKMKSVRGGLELYSTASHPDIRPSGGMQDPINFYLGKEAYEEFRVKPAREKRIKAEQMKSQPPEAR